MKVYIARPGQPDFVTNASSFAAAIVIFWMVGGETPKTNYRVHQGRRRKARTVSAAIAYWRLSADLRAPLSAVLRENSSASDYQTFCQTAVTVGELLGE